jgi:hypothetical protein
MVTVQAALKILSASWSNRTDENSMNVIWRPLEAGVPSAVFPK